jgi:hypothetical protein
MPFRAARRTARTMNRARWLTQPIGLVSGRLSRPGDAQVHQQSGPGQRGSAALLVARASRPLR